MWVSRKDNISSWLTLAVNVKNEDVIKTSNLMTFNEKDTLSNYIKEKSVSDLVLSLVD